MSDPVERAPQAEQGRGNRTVCVTTRSLALHPDFRRLWIGDAASQVGVATSLFLLPLLAARVLRATPFQVGLVSMAMTASFLVLGLPAGAWVDRMRRRNVLFTCDVGRAVVLSAIPFAAVLGLSDLALLTVVALAYGALTVFFDVAYQSYLPELVGSDRLVEGNAKLGATASVAQMAGPVAGGLAAQAFTVPYALVANTVCFAWSALWIWRIRVRQPRPERRHDRHLGREIAEGLRFVLGHRLLRAIAACTGPFNLYRSASQPMVIVLMAVQLRLGAGTVGLFFTLGAAGGVVGAVLARRIALLVGEGPVIWGAALAAGSSALLVPFMESDWRLWLAAAGECGFTFFASIYDVAQVSFRQALCPDRLLGRMNATMRFLVWGTLPLGAFLGGVLAGVVGVRTVVWIAAVGMALAFLPVFLSPLRTMRELPTVDRTGTEI